MIKTVGIDIGSQKTIMVADDGEIVRTSTGSVSFPTLIAFQDKCPRSIGDEATSGETIIPMINILAGKLSEELLSNQALSLAKLNVNDTSKSAEGIPFIDISYGSNSDSLSTTSLLALYLRKLWERISQACGEGKGLAIAVPPNASKDTVRAYFDACIIAGIDTANVSVVDSADAIVAAYARKLSAIKGPDRAVLDNKLVALVEMGHTQTTIVIVKVNPANGSSKDGSSSVEKLATVHDGNLGCLHFDFKLFDHFRKICASKHGTMVEHGTRRGNRLLAGCERIKKLLSQLYEGVVTVENLTDNGDVSFSLKRDEFMEATSDLLSRFKDHVNKAVQIAADKLSSQSDEAKKVSYVEIFGGGLRMPAIQNILTDIFGQDIALGAKLDDGSVAIGAALVANRRTASIEAAIAAATATAMDELSSPTTSTEKADSETIYNFEEVAQARGLTEEERESGRLKELSMQSHDQDMRQLLAVRNSLESYILEMRSAPKRKFGELIDSQKLNVLLDDSEGWIWDNQDASLQDLTEKDQGLRASVQEICQQYFVAVNNEKLDIEKKLDEEAAKAAAERNEDEDEDHDNRKLKKADRMRLVVKNKDEGTELFKGGNYRPAAARYHKSLAHSSKFFDLSPDDEAEVKALKISLHLNLATCYHKMENYDQMIRNIEDTLALDPKNAKAHFRRSQYYEAKKDIEKALEDAKKCQSLMDTEDKLVRQSVERLTREVAKQKDKEKKMWGKAFAS